MRLRHIKGSEEIIANHKYVSGMENAGNWKGYFSQISENFLPERLILEIGMGKGQFIMEMARENPKDAFIGIEMYSSVLLRALQKMEKEELVNLRFMRQDAAYIEESFSYGEVDGIYLNFSDPWPKDRHAKRRLPGRVFLQRFAKILSPEGFIEFKTDNKELFDFALGEIEAGGFRLSEYTYDLHNCPSMLEGNIMTEYEEKFVSLGHPICKYIIKK